ncbi:MAG: CPBP family intramembrane metalloprotease [Calditrichaeota bacterium]|nr:MAG: CPBP family intramembrane metalloprotease [Calditrichota bacterium]MBL1206303.1 CPBP family intramembrane metalloprotease [Calditrichota bacterium]NOG46129.1 CPBP family intramembrane metalloprotease [Calditrichota bacterium]
MNKIKIPEPVEALVVVLLSFSGLVLFSLTFLGFISGGTENQSDTTLFSMIFMFGKIVFFGLPVFYCYKKNYPLQKIFKIKPVSKEVIIFSIIIGLSLIAITDEIQRLVDLIVPMPDSMKELLKSAKDVGGMEWALLFIGSIFIAPLADEGLFRGFLQVSLEEKGDPVRAVILTSVTWALIHISPYLAIPIFILGIFLGYLSWKTKSILPSIVIQALFGFIAVILLDSSLEEGFNSWYLMGDHVSPFILILSGGGLYYSIKMIDNLGDE